MAVGNSCRRATRDTQESCQLWGKRPQKAVVHSIQQLDCELSTPSVEHHVSQTR